MATRLILDNGFVSQWVAFSIGGRWLCELLESDRLRACQILNLVAHAHLYFLLFSNVESCDWDDDVVVEGEDEEEKNYDYMIRYFEAHGADCFGGERVAHYKAWRTKLGGR